MYGGYDCIEVAIAKMDCFRICSSHISGFGHVFCDRKESLLCLLPVDPQLYISIGEQHMDLNNMFVVLCMMTTGNIPEHIMLQLWCENIP